MLALRNPNPFGFPATPPGFDPTHPAASNLLISAISSNGAGEFYNLLSGKVASVNNTPTAVINVNIGPSQYYSAAAGASYFAIPTSGLTYLTFGLIFNVVAASGSHTEFLICNNSTNQAAIYINTPTNNLIYTALSNILFSSTLSVITGHSYFLGCSLSNTTSTGRNSIFVLKDLSTGSVLTSSIATNNNIGSGDGNLYIGNRGSFDRNSNCAFSAIMATSSLATIQTLSQWAADPWSFWYPRQVRNFVGAQGFIPAWAQGSNLPVLGTGTY